MSQMKRERNKEILYLSGLGHTCEAIGVLYGISKQRVHKIVWAERIYAANERSDLGDSIKNWQKKGYTDKAIVNALGYHYPTQKRRKPCNHVSPVTDPVRVSTAITESTVDKTTTDQ